MFELPEEELDDDIVRPERSNPNPEADARAALSFAQSIDEMLASERRHCTSLFPNKNSQ